MERSSTLSKASSSVAGEEESGRGNSIAGFCAEPEGIGKSSARIEEKATKEEGKETKARNACGQENGEREGKGEEEEKVQGEGRSKIQIVNALGCDAASDVKSLSQDLLHLNRVLEQQQKQILDLTHRLKALPNGKAQVEDSLSNMSYAELSKLNAKKEQAHVCSDEALTLAFPALLRGLTDLNDVRNVQNMCQIILADQPFGDWQTLFKSFYDQVVACRDSLPAQVLALETSLPSDWYMDPWYLLYVQHVVDQDAGFDGLCDMLPYIRDHLGFRNICLLPHYESPMADGGYDVSDYVTRASLGGEPAFERFMNKALSMGLRIATDAVFNHTSTEHPWFQKALAGEEKYLAYYVQRNGREKIGEWDQDGDIICRYRDPDGKITERMVVFPDVDRTHGLWVEINGQTYQFYRSFFPFQVDLNLQNPDVISELLQVLGKEVRQGVLGKRMDAIVHWIKKPGCASEGMPEGHALQALFKSFLKHVHRRSIVMPEVVRDMKNAATYAGIQTKINRNVCSSEGDAIFCFEMQAALREMTYFQTVAPYWNRIFRSPNLENTTWLHLLEHHDETFMGFFPAEIRTWLAEYIKTHSGIVYKNGMSAGGRIADCLNNDEERIATALFILYITPGTPLVYAGTEIGLRSNHDHAGLAADVAFETFRRLGVYVGQKACFDPRELQRGPIPRVLFEKAMESKYPPLEMVRRMNRIKMQRTWLSGIQAQPFDSGDVGVLCMGRSGGGQKVICLANLTGSEKIATIPRGQVEAFLGDLRICKLVDIWEGHVEIKDSHVRIKLERFGRAVVTATGNKR